MEVKGWRGRRPPSCAWERGRSLVEADFAGSKKRRGPAVPSSLLREAQPSSFLQFSWPFTLL